MTCFKNITRTAVFFLVIRAMYRGFQLNWKIGALLIIAVQPCVLLGQTGAIKGRVFNSINNEAVPFANIVVDSTLMGTTSDDEGHYEIQNLKPGTYNVMCSFIGFSKAIYYEIRVISSRPTMLDIALVEQRTRLDEVEITPTLDVKVEESPVSLRTINASEILRNPGGNRDISKVVQILPGVASTASFRNDLIVRGGAPNENRFYLDGIEVPNINHFATQGSSGGPIGMINVNFIREVDFYAGAFPANRGNAMSSVLEFRQIEGNDEKIGGTFMLGSSDIGVTLNGPVGNKSTFLFSARRSYLQFLFKALRLPFLPTYNDFQYKQVVQLDDKNKITLIGLGAIDQFQLNTRVNQGLEDEDIIRRNNYILGNLPVNNQWNYTAGAKWTHFATNSYTNLVVSRNHLKSTIEKYQDNIVQPELLILDYSSQEIENKVRLENTFRQNGWKWNAGIGFENARYTNSTYNKKALGNQVQVIDFSSSLDINKLAAFTQISRTMLQDKIMLSAGLRTDINDYSSSMSNPVDQLSPRFSAAYFITKKVSINGNVARYFQLPAYTVLGYRDSTGVLVNKINDVSYIRSDHTVLGVEYNPTVYSKISIEGFFKRYHQYPFSIRDSISLANLGSDFGVIGNEPVVSTSVGRSYGAELLLQQKLNTSIYGILAYTYVVSEFEDRRGTPVPSSWDNRHILNITAGREFKGYWQAGMRFRFQSGAPYTAYELERSSLKEVWDITNQGLYDWTRLNQERYPATHGLDIRIDKQWFFEKWSINLYLDVQNVYNFQTEGQPYLDVARDNSGNPITDPSNPAAYETVEIENTSGTVLPSIGLMIEL